MRKRRTIEHVRAHAAERFVQWICACAGFTTTSMGEGSDYGIDLFVQTFDRHGFIENGEIKIQVKAPKKVRLLRHLNAISLTLDRRDLHYWLHETDPVFVVVYDSLQRAAYWCYIQRYFAKIKTPRLNFARKFQTIHIDCRDVLSASAVRRFALWKNQVNAQTKGLARHG